MPLSGDQTYPDQTGLHYVASSSDRIRSTVLNDQNIWLAPEFTHNLELIQVAKDVSKIPEKLAFTNVAQLSSHLGRHDSPPNKIAIELFLIHQRNSWAPPKVSKDMITTLMNHRKIGSGFFHVLSAFRDRILPTEEAFSGVVQSVSTPDCSELGYVYKYSERKDVQSENPWRIRQTGMYQVYDHHRSTLTFVVISPSPDAEFKTHLEDILRDKRIRSQVLANPVLLHTVLVSTHLSSWKNYLLYYETLLLKAGMQSTCAEIDIPLVNFETLKTVRAVERHLLLLDPLLTSLQELLAEITNTTKSLEAAHIIDQASGMVILAVIVDLEKEAVSYEKHAKYLSRQAQSSAQSISDTLNLNFQMLAQEQNINMFMIAKSAREDSVAIRALTLVTSFYLPFSFVATILGMNLVAFDPSSRHLLVSSEFWLYFVISVPLTALTLTFWRWKLRNPGTDRESMAIKLVQTCTDAEIV